MVLALPSQRTWTVSDLETAALFNSNIRDAVNFLLNPPIFSGSNSAAQSVANNTWAGIVQNTNVLDTYSGHSTTVNNTRYVVPVAGSYLVVVHVGFSGNASGRRGAGVGVNGAGILATSEELSVPGAVVTVSVATSFITVPLNVGDYIEGLAFQDSGGALNTLAAAASVECLWVHA